MADVAAGPWWVVAGAALPSLASGIWVVSRWWMDRADRNTGNALNRQERLTRDVEARRAALSREQVELFERVRAELVRCQARLKDVERDRDRGWDLARYWNQRSHELRHAGMNAQSIVAGLCAREDVAVPIWPDMTVVQFEDATI